MKLNYSVEKTSLLAIALSVLILGAPAWSADPWPGHVQLGPSESPLANAATKIVGIIKVTDEETKKLVNRGQLKMGMGDKLDELILSKGNLLLAPDKDLIVRMSRTKILMRGGSVLLLMANEHGDSTIFDLNENKKGDVKVIFGSKSLRLRTGLEVFLSEKKHADFERDNPGSTIAYSKVSDLDLDTGTGFITEFSIVSAFRNIRTLKELLTSKDAKEAVIAHKLLHNAAVFGDLRYEYGFSRPSKLVMH